MTSRPVNIAPTPGSSFSTPSIITRDWNIPPRPKPGRKPAGDAPPTKRKAQNREAQRAFRERRAARVGELEENLKDFQRSSQREQEDLVTEIKSLRNELQQFNSQMSLLQRRHSDLQTTLEQERRLRLEAEASFDALKKRSDAGSDTGSGRSSKRVSIENEERSDRSIQEMAGITCGKCDSTSRCQCVEDFIANGTGLEQAKDSEEQVGRATFEENEIDFTSRFSSQKPTGDALGGPKSSFRPSVRVTDPCGFCRNDTECICAAMAQESTQGLPRTSSQDQGNGTPALSTTKPTSCSNNPGNCNQCRADPTSTIFCKTLAATRQAGPDVAATERMTTQNEPTLSCADAFSALSRHHAFPQASQQLGAWVSQLTSVPSNINTEGRTAFEIEAASVMTVLKFFDTRYGQAPHDVRTGED